MARGEGLGLPLWVRFGAWLRCLPYPWFALLTVAAVLIHTGFRLPWRPDSRFEEASSNWPAGTSWDSSPIWLLTPRVIGASEGNQWDLLWILVALATLAILFWLTRTSLPGATQRHFLLAVFASGIPVVITSRLGTYDIPFILGTVLTVMLPRRLWLMGPILVAAANAEMGVVAGLCLVLIGLATNRGDARKRGAFVMTTSLIVLVTIILLQGMQGRSFDQSRLALLPSNLSSGLAGNLPWLPLIVSTMYFGAWFVVLLMAGAELPLLKRVSLVSGLVLIPLLTALFTLDGTRVAVSVSGMAFLFAMKDWFNHPSVVGLLEHDTAWPPLFLSALAVLTLATPAVSVFVPLLDEGFYPPWQGLYVLLWSL